jgi:hypothetical protein
MERPTRKPRRALIAVCGCAAAAAAAFAPAAVADSIPRPPGAIDNRGYELVSSPENDHQLVLQSTPISTDATRVIYAYGGPVPASPSGVYPMQRATRTASGWRRENILPPRAQMLPHDYTYLISAAPADLGWVAATANDGIGKTTTSTSVSLAMLDGLGGQSILHTFPVYFGASGLEVVASEDGKHLFVPVVADADPSLPGAVPGVGNVYDFGSGAPVLVSVLPSTGLAPACGVSQYEFGFTPPGASLQTEHWASTDGSRVFFATRGENCGGPLQLYMRDVNAGITTQVSANPLEGDPDNGIGRFLQAAADGSWVIYTTATSYDPRDGLDGNNSDMDVYRWDAATGKNTCLTCTGRSAEVLEPVAVSEDGSHVYFSSVNQLADAPSTAPEASTPNTYVWQQHRPLIHWIGQTDGVTPLSNAGGYVTPNGNVLIFASSEPDLNAITGTDNGGTTQYYRYNSVEDSLTCISCPAKGAATRGALGNLTNAAGSVLTRARPASDDGSEVFFTAYDALVPEDVNKDADIYEWHNGVVKLITSGTTVRTTSSPPQVVSASPSGNDLLFYDYASLTADTSDATRKLYDARVGGGFPPPPTPPTPCHGECRGTASAPPLLPSIGSGGPTSGNAAATPPATVTIARPTAAQLRRLARTGQLGLSVKVSGPGAVHAFAQASIHGSVATVANGTATARRAGSVLLTLRLSKAASKQLSRARRLRVVFAAGLTGAPEVARLTVLLKAPARGGAARRAAVHSNNHGR